LVRYGWEKFHFYAHDMKRKKFCEIIVDENGKVRVIVFLREFFLLIYY